MTCAATVLVAAPDVRGGYDRFALAKELVAGAGALLALAWTVAGARGLRPRGADLALAGYLGLGVLSAAQSGANEWLAWRSMTVSAAGVACYWAASYLTGPRRRALVAALGGVVAVTAATAIAEAHGAFAHLSLPGRAPGGTLGHRNWMAHTVLAGLPLLWMSALVATRAATLALTTTAVMLASHAIVLSHCRGAWLAAIALGVVVAVALRRSPGLRRRAALLLAATAIAVAGAVWLPSDLRWNATDHYQRTLASIADASSGTGRGRLIQYRTTAEIAVRAPLLGVGPGGWSIAYARHAMPGDPNVRPRRRQPVNRLANADWLAIAAERGLPALALLLVFGALHLRPSRDGLRHREPRAVAVTGTLAVLALSGVVDANILRPETAVLAFATLGALAERPAATAPLPLTAPLRAAALVAVLAAFTALTVRAARSLDAAREVSELARTTTAADRRAHLEHAVRLTPADYRLHVRLAQIHGDCDHATAYARHALALHPGLDAARRVLRRCGAHPERASREAP